MPKLMNGSRTRPVPKQDRFRFGWRFVTRRRSNGTTVSVQVPLTMDDVLHPREGDCIPENTVHNDERDYLKNAFRIGLKKRRHVRVFSDCIIKWGVAEVRDHSPDVSVFANVRDRQRRWGVFPVAEQGARPLLVVEIVSPDASEPRARNNDVVFKREHYHRVGVPLYLIVDQQRQGGPRRLVLLRRTAEGYEEVPADEQGRVFLEPVGVFVALRENRVVCYDAKTGEEIFDYPELADARQDAEKRAKAAQRQTKAAQRQAEAAEKKALAEAEAREAAEKKLQELEEELRRLRGQTPGSGSSR